MGRFARTHGPFTTEDCAASLGLAVAVAASVLAGLLGDGQIVRGAFRPDGAGSEWVDGGVLRRIKRRSLAVLRSEIEPVDADAMAQFAVAWHGIGGERKSPDRLQEIIRQLQGYPVPADQPFPEHVD